MKGNIIGIDVGGTKCAVIYGKKNGGDLQIVEKEKFATTTVTETIDNILSVIEAIMVRHSLNSSNTQAIGISCGGPLNSQTGVVMSPPNLAGWDNIPIVDIVQRRFGIPTGIHNDANACALAEWKFGAGQGTRNMVFLTFGTGLGAGLILNGALYTGTNDNAGEVGHIRLSDFGPVGYGKSGSFEGFSSGGGIAQLARLAIMEHHQMGLQVEWCSADELNCINAHKVAQAAMAGDPLAQSIYKTASTYLGRGLSIIIDTLNPEAIILGGIYSRNTEMMEPVVLEVIENEALPGAKSVCRILAAGLGEQIGDYAALSVAADLIDKSL